MKYARLLCEAVKIMALPLLAFLVVYFTIQSYQISGSSMHKNLQDKYCVLVNRVIYVFRTPKRGEVIVFRKPDEPDIDLIKRVIGLPGDIVKLNTTTVCINGIELDEPYITQKYNPEVNTWEVPPNRYFVIGDNRPKSEDSRAFGFVSKDFIIGKAIAVYWPPNHLKLINAHLAVFASVK